MPRWAQWILIMLLALSVACGRDAPRDPSRDAGQPAEGELRVHGKLDPNDAKDSFSRPCQVHLFKMAANATAIITLKSRDFEPIVRVENSSQRALASDEDTDGSGAVIVFKAPKDDIYRIKVAGFAAKTGGYHLTVELASAEFVQANDKLALARQLMQQSDKAYQKNDKEAAAKLAAQTEALLEEIETKFADVKLPDGAAGARAKDSLFELRHLSVGKTAMEIDGEDIDGKGFKLSDYRGRVVVLDFWAHW